MNSVLTLKRGSPAGDTGASSAAASSQSVDNAVVEGGDASSGSDTDDEDLYSSHWIFYGGSRPYRTYNGTPAISEEFQLLVIVKFRKWWVLDHNLNHCLKRGG